jgi:hypothetical protein
MSQCKSAQYVKLMEASMIDSLMNSLSKSPYTITGTKEKKNRNTAIPLSKFRCLMK